MNNSTLTIRTVGFRRLCRGYFRVLFSGLYSRKGALLHDSTAARVGALFQLLVQDTTAQDFGLPSSAIRLRM